MSCRPERSPALRKGDDFRDLASIQQSFQIPEKTELFPVRESATHMKVMLSDNTQKSKHAEKQTLAVNKPITFSPRARVQFQGKTMFSSG